jgi:hypothetical protein
MSDEIEELCERLERYGKPVCNDCACSFCEHAYIHIAAVAMLRKQAAEIDRLTARPHGLVTIDHEVVIGQ